MLDYYQTESRKTAIYPKAVAVVYPTLGLQGESAEVWGKLVPDKGGKVATVSASAIQPELGDVLWYITNLTLDLDLTLNDIAEDLTGGLCPQKFADITFALLDSKDKRSPYVKLSLAVGQVSENVKKSLRDHGSYEQRLPKIREALGDVLRAWLEINDRHKIDPDDTALANVLKLRSRMDRGKLQGDGDTR